MFDELIEFHPCTRSRISQPLRINHSPDFENGIVKILSGTASDLIEAAKLKTDFFIVPERLPEFADIRNIDRIVM